MKCKCGMEHELPINPLGMVICDCGEEVDFGNHIRKIELKGKRTTYYIYDDGRVYSTTNKKYLRQMLLNTHYAISINQKFYYVNRLVAEAFIPNLPKHYVIKHKDKNFANNHVDNLEVEDRSEYYYRVFTIPGQMSGKYHNTVYSVIKKTFDGKLLTTYNTLEDACKEEEINEGQMRRKCLKKFNPVCFKHEGFYYFYDAEGNELMSTKDIGKMVEFLVDIKSKNRILRFVLTP